MAMVQNKLRPRVGSEQAGFVPAVLDEWLKSLADGPSTAAAAEIVRRIQMSPAEQPRWLVRAQELWWLGRPVKRLYHVAVNQEAVLNAFQAAGWPRRIDDPLPAVTGRKDKNRRRGTIKSLNRGLAAGSIRFRSDGSGCGVCWEKVRQLVQDITPDCTPNGA